MEENIKMNSLESNSVSPATPGGPEEPQNPGFRYTNPANNEYPVIAYNNVQLINYEDWISKKQASPQDMEDFLKTVIDCGFNVNLWVSGPSEEYGLLNNYFAKAAELGLPSILNISGMTPIKIVDNNGNVYYVPSQTALETIMTNYWDKVNLWGYMLTDEPHYAGWGEKDDDKIPVETGMASMVLAAYNNVCNAKGNKKPVFFNLAASIKETYTGMACPDNPSDEVKRSLYAKYLQNILRRFKPIMLSVDIYPIRVSETVKYNQDTHKDDIYSVTNIIDEYFYSLEVIGEFSKTYKIPFWLFIKSSVSLNLNADGTLHHLYPTPSVGILRYQAMNALAHGIQGLVFWSYGMPNNTWHDAGKTLPSEVYISAPIANHRKTEIWENCKKVIPEIKIYGDVLLNAQFIEARHVFDAETTKYTGTTRFNGQFGCISSVTASGKGCVITHLKKGDQDYIAIVSHDWENEQSIVIGISSDYGWEVVNEKVLAIVDGKIQHRFKPGGMLLIKYNNKVE